MSYPQSMDRLRNIMSELREKCPWDRKQTIASLRVQTIEELYELTDAISTEDWPGMREELGDLLLHIVFYSHIANESGQFSLDEVIEGVCNKLVARHPHIYSGLTVQDEQEVKQNWEQIKLKEGKRSVLSGVPQALPALVKGLRLQEKAAQVGFEWDDIKDVAEKVNEEWHELQEAIENKDRDGLEAEFGDLLFSLINYARYLNIDPENALERTNRKFKTRFEQMESQAAAAGANLKDLTLRELDQLWDKAKQSEQNPIR